MIRLISIAIVPKTRRARVTLRSALASLTTEDPALSIVSDGEETVIAGMGEQHLDIVIDRLRREFDVEARVGRPSVVYAETVTRPAEADVKYVDRSGPGYAHVKLRLEPRRAGSGYAFTSSVTGGTVPARFIPSVDAGIRAELEHGMLSGYHVVDVGVMLYDGSYHDTDSSDAAFKAAAGRAFREAAGRAAPVLLEPVMRVETSTPRESLDEVTRLLNARQAKGEAVPDADDHCTVVAFAPLSQLFGYAWDVRRITHGKGSVEMRFAEYAPVQHADGSDADRDAIVGAPLRPRPAPRSSSVALPEPTEDRGDSR